jgi:hypothetical protein
MAERRGVCTGIRLPRFDVTIIMETQAKVMDVLFLIDATGSMSTAIKASRAKAAEIAINLRVKNPAVSVQFGCVCYRGPVDSPSDVHEIHQLDADID